MNSFCPEMADPLAGLTVENLLQMAASASIAFMFNDMRGRILQRNALFTELFGDCETWAPEVWLRCFHPDDMPRLIRSVRTAAQSNRAVVLRDAARVREAEDWCWLSTCSILQVDAHNNPLGWFSFFAKLPTFEFLDQRIRAALIGSDVRYRALFDHSSDTMLLLSNHRIIDCNDAAAAMFRVSRRQLLGTRGNALVASRQRSGEPLEDCLDRLAAMVAKGARSRWEVTGRRLDDSGDFEIEGTLVRIKLGEDTFDVVTLRDISEHIEAERRLASSNRELALRNENLAWLQESCSRIYEQVDLDSLAPLVVESLQAHYSAPEVHFALREGAQNRLVSTSRDVELTFENSLRPRSATLDRAMASEEKLIIVRDVDRELADTGFVLDMLHERKVELCVFIMLYDKAEELGVLCLDYTDASKFDDADLDGLKLFARTLSLVLVKLQSVAALEYQASHDSLTGLHNRSVLHSRFQRWQDGPDGPAILLLLDLDRFKEVNDTLGHHVGDDLLRQIGGRLRTGLGYRRGVLCRLGGDEFAVLVQGVRDDDELALQIAGNLRDAIREPFVVDGVHLEISASVGVAMYPRHGRDSHALLRFADVAMYEAKHRGAGALLYDTRLDLHSPERLRVIIDLNSGIRERELLLHYQPKMDLRTREIIGCEALVRWQHRRDGLMAPDLFLPLAEVGDTIHALTAFVIEEAVKQQRAWHARGIDLHVAINLSARNLIDDRVCSQLERLIQEHGLLPGALELEITETALLHEPNRAVALLERIAALGVRLSVDDFGTGYSSLAYLRRLPLDALKIDRSFIQDMLAEPQDAVIVQSIITLGHNLNLSVVAEGVENAEVLERLGAVGCDQVQGFYLSRPLTGAQVPDWLEARSTKVF